MKKIPSNLPIPHNKKTPKMPLKHKTLPQGMADSSKAPFSSAPLPFLAHPNKFKPLLSLFLLLPAILMSLETPMPPPQDPTPSTSPSPYPTPTPPPGQHAINPQSDPRLPEPDPRHSLDPKDPKDTPYPYPYPAPTPPQDPKDTFDSKTQPLGDPLLEDLIQKGIKKSQTEPTNLLQNKSGFLLGASIWVKNFQVSEIIQQLQTLSQVTPSLHTGLILGYQRYFNPSFGWKFSTQASIGTNIRIKALRILPVEEATPNPLISISPAYIPITLGFHLGLLLDLITTSTKAFGLELGLGYKLEWLVPSLSKSTSSLAQFTQTPQALLNTGIYPYLGFHYIIKHHQISLLYKPIEYVLTNQNIWEINSSTQNLPLKARFQQSHAALLAYIYRF